MFFGRTLLFSGALLATIAQAAPVSEDWDDSCWNGDEAPEAAPASTDLPSLPTASSIASPPAVTASAIFQTSTSIVASSIPSVSVTPSTPETSPATNNKAVSANAAATKGKASFYGGNTNGGQCSFSTLSSLPAGLYGTALSDKFFNSPSNAAHCGQCVSVAGPNGKTIKAMITDLCPGCNGNDLDLYQDAFAQIGNPTDGIIDVSWSYVACGITSPLVLHNKEGVSEHWFSMQVVNSNAAISKLDVSTDGGKTWITTTRQVYNFFEQPSGTPGATTVTVRVTSDSGKTITVPNVKIASGASTTGTSNF